MSPTSAPPTTEATITIQVPVSKLVDIQAVLAPKKPKREKPKHPRDLRGLKPAEQDAVLRVALAFYDVPRSPGCKSGIDGRRLYQTISMMMNEGVHRKVIADPIGKRLSVTPDGMLYFQRAKKTGGAADTNVPVYEDMKTWIVDYVTWLCARGGIHWRLINELLAAVGRRAGLSRPFNPLVCRHTCGTNLFRNGADALRIASWLNCTVKTASDHYCKTDAEDLESSLRQSGSFRMSTTVRLPDDHPT